MANEDFLSQSQRKVKDMDRRPLPTHIDDVFVEEDDEKWIPGKKKTRKPRKPKKPSAKNPEGQGKDVRETIGHSIDALSKIFVLLISLAALVGIVLLALWVSSIYGIDLGGQLQESFSNLLRQIGL